jgi:hypothetical protein
MHRCGPMSRLHAVEGGARWRGPPAERARVLDVVGVEVGTVGLGGTVAASDGNDVALAAELPSRPFPRRQR